MLCLLNGTEFEPFSGHLGHSPPPTMLFQALTFNRLKMALIQRR